MRSREMATCACDAAESPYTLSFLSRASQERPSVGESPTQIFPPDIMDTDSTTNLLAGVELSHGASTAKNPLKRLGSKIKQELDEIRAFQKLSLEEIRALNQQRYAEHVKKCVLASLKVLLADTEAGRMKGNES